MSKARKLLDQMAANPRDWRMEQVETVARAFGLTIHRPGGSHHVLRNAEGRKISIPAHRPIKPVYIKALLRLIVEGQGDET
jgi:predicted RNA binding protein YcfA (HicA-like mRNA interferase family)